MKNCYAFLLVQSALVLARIARGKTQVALVSLATFLITH